MNLISLDGLLLKIRTSSPQTKKISLIKSSNLSQEKIVQDREEIETKTNFEDKEEGKGEKEGKEEKEEKEDREGKEEKGVIEKTEMIKGNAEIGLTEGIEKIDQEEEDIMTIKSQEMNEIMIVIMIAAEMIKEGVTSEKNQETRADSNKEEVIEDQC